MSKLVGNATSFVILAHMAPDVLKLGIFQNGG
jgi:hypothetical protein